MQKTEDSLNKGVEEHVALIKGCSDSIDPKLDGLYFVSEDDGGLQHPWLFRLSKGKGILYDDLKYLAMRKLEINPSTLTINFETEEFDNIIYRFRGQFTCDRKGVKGYFHSIYVDDKGEFSNNPTKYELSLDRIDTSSTDDGLSGFYSSVEYNEESGDLNGAELIVIPRNKKFFGIFTSYADGTKSHLVKLRQKGQKMEFKTLHENTSETYSQKFSVEVLRNKLKISYVGDNVSADARPHLLPKRQSLTDFLTKESVEWAFNCEQNSARLKTMADLDFLKENKESSEGNAVILARLGKKETDLYLSARRLLAVRKYLTSQGVKEDRIIGAFGEKTKGLGRIEIHLGGSIEWILPLGHRKDIPVGDCMDDEYDRKVYQLRKNTRGKMKKKYGRFL